MSMSKKSQSIPSTISLVLAICVYLYVAMDALLLTSLSGVIGGVGLFGISPDPIDYLPIYVFVVSLIGIFLLYKYYKSIVIWFFAILLWAAVNLSLIVE